MITLSVLSDAFSLYIHSGREKYCKKEVQTKVSSHLHVTQGTSITSIGDCKNAQWPSKFWEVFRHESDLSLLLFLLLLSFFWAVIDQWFQFKTIWESITEAGKFYHGVAMRSRRQFYFEFLSHTSDYFRAYFRLHWDDHSSQPVMAGTGVNGLMVFRYYK